jgi:hypothetical protein
MFYFAKDIVNKYKISQGTQKKKALWKDLKTGTDFLEGAHPQKLFVPPPGAFGTAPKSFCAPANYIYYDLIVSYLIILTKFVKLPKLWSQIIRSHHAGLENKFC